MCVYDGPQKLVILKTVIEDTSNKGSVVAYLRIRLTLLVCQNAVP
jgi:hypothetical protein